MRSTSQGTDWHRSTLLDRMYAPLAGMLKIEFRQLAPSAIGQGWFYGMPVACEVVAKLVNSRSMRCSEVSNC